MLSYSANAVQLLPTETIHAICSPCYGKMPNLREPIPLVFPYCHRARCCYCGNATAYEGIFYRDAPRNPCHCQGLAKGIGDLSRQHSAQVAAARAQGLFSVDERYILLEDDRGRGGHLHPVSSLTAAEREKWLQNVAATGRKVYTGYPQQGQ